MADEKKAEVKAPHTPEHEIPKKKEQPWEHFKKTSNFKNNFSGRKVMNVRKTGRGS